MDDQKNKLRISVVIITFNRAGMLGDTLFSLYQQQRLPEEVVVVDNNSTDATKEVVLGFNGRLNIRYVFEATQGVAVARNTGIKNSTGEIIAFIDDDCIADKEWLRFLELPFLKDPLVGMVAGEIRACRVKGTLVEDFCIADAFMRMCEAPLKEERTA